MTEYDALYKNWYFFFIKKNLKGEGKKGDGEGWEGREKKGKGGGRGGRRNTGGARIPI